MSLHKVSWLFMQGFTTKYYRCKARWRFCCEPQGYLAYKKDMTNTFAAQFIK